MNWSDITLKQFKKLKGLDLKDLSDQITAAEILLNINADDMTWVEFSKKLKDLNFLEKEIPRTIIRKYYTLNGRKYNTSVNLQELSVARYMDFCNLAPTGDYEKILAVVLIPDGKEYGDYDLDQVYNDILDMNMVDVYSVFNFFKMQFIVCIKTMTDFSVKQLKGDRKLQAVVREVLDSMVSYSMLDL